MMTIMQEWKDASPVPLESNEQQTLVARGGHHGLYIELKRRKDSKVTKEQLEWIADLVAQGYVAAVCRGCDEAISLITRYLTGRE